MRSGSNTAKPKLACEIAADRVLVGRLSDDGRTLHPLGLHDRRPGMLAQLETQAQLAWEPAGGVTERALQAGASSVREPQDMFYGDRTAGVKDPFGNSWGIATHIEDVSPEELKKRAEAFQKQFAAS